MINQRIEAISIAAREQSAGLREVSKAVNQMDQMVEESDAARLRQLLAGFKIALPGSFHAGHRGAA